MIVGMHMPPNFIVANSNFVNTNVRFQMAKPQSKKNPLDDLYKSGVLMKGNDERLELQRVPLGIPQIDGILGGGIPLGRTTMLVGPESTGKTLIAQYAVAAIQRQEKRNRAVLVDLEQSYDEEWWALSGVDIDQLVVSRPRTGEMAIDIIRALIEHDPELGIIILDSAAAMTPAPELERSAEDKTMGLQAKLINLLFRIVMPLNQHAAFVVINQVRDNIGVPGETYPGGRGLRHSAHVILRTKRDGWIEENQQRIGFNIEVTCRKNKTASEMEQSATLPFHFRSQIDLVQAYIEEGIIREIIKARPPYYYIGEQHFMGKNSLRTYLQENPEAWDWLNEQLSAVPEEKPFAATFKG